MDDRDLQTRSNAVLIVGTLSSFIGPFLSSSVNVALPTIGHELSMGAVSLGWVNTSFLLASAAFMIPFGKLGDIYGRKRIFLSGIGLLIVSSALNAEVHSSSLMILCRVFQGFASSMVNATAVPIVVSGVPPERRGKALGLTVAAVYLGLSTGPFFGGFVTQQLGWRYLFWTNVPLGLVLLGVTLLLLKGDWVEAGKTKFDVAGSLLLAIALLSTMYGFSTLPAWYAVILIAAGLAAAALFVWYEKRQEAPVLHIDLFEKNTVFAFSTLAALINYAATFAISFLLSIYLQQVKGLTPKIAGLVLVAQPAMQAIFSPIAGKWSDKHEPRVLASLGMGATLFGIIMLLFLSKETSSLYVVVCLLVQGLGFGLFSSPNMNAIMGAVPRQSYGVAGAIVSAVRQVGMMFSMGIVMMTMALWLGNTEIAAGNVDAFLQSMRIAFVVFALACFGGIFASLARGNVRRNAPAT